MTTPYRFAVAAMFKNEEHAMVEWLEHYLARGAEHFYLIDDGSTDRSVELLEPYMERGLITLERVQEPYYLGRQRALYNRFFLPLLKEKKVEWLFICDLDEFLWSPTHMNLWELVRQTRGVGQIQIQQTFFGSSGHLEQPGSLVAGFTRRSAACPTEGPRCFKYFVNSAFDFSSLNVHHATFTDAAFEKNGAFIILGPEYLILNHYSCQSLDLWKRVKCVRGDSDNYLKRTEAMFYDLDFNDVEDRRLLEQNQRERLK